jgi:hypothetical protein
MPDAQDEQRGPAPPRRSNVAANEAEAAQQPEEEFDEESGQMVRRKNKIQDRNAVMDTCGGYGCSKGCSIFAWFSFHDVGHNGLASFWHHFGVGTNFCWSGLERSSHRHSQPRDGIVLH